jgi:hypothetical protein
VQPTRNYRSTHAHECLCEVMKRPTLVQRRPTDCGVPWCVIKKPRGRGGRSQRWGGEQEMMMVIMIIIIIINGKNLNCPCDYTTITFYREIRDVLNCAVHITAAHTRLSELHLMRNVLHTYFLPLWSRVHLEKLTGIELVKKFYTFYGTRRFITAFTSARHLSPSLASSIQCTYPHPTS